MAFERLPQLRRPEETKVSARVIDVFYRPQTKPVDETLGLLAQSLERFNPNLEKYIKKKEEVNFMDTNEKLTKIDLKLLPDYLISNKEKFKIYFK